jgi:hypothetical protein
MYHSIQKRIGKSTQKVKCLWLVSCIALGLFSCSNSGKSRTPADIMQPDSMASLLTDVHILQASLQLGLVRHDSIIPAPAAFAELWKKHHITQKDYNRYVDYYTRHPRLLDSVYEKVLINVSEEKAKLLGNARH